MIIERNKNLNTKKWRKAIWLFAAFFCFSVVFSACKKKKNPLGEGVYPSDYIMGSTVVDTFNIISYTVLEDTTLTKDPEFNLLGVYNDEKLGLVEASFYTQLTLSGFSPDFGDLSTVKIDSAVVAFEFGGHYGTLNKQLFEVYELTEDLSRDSSYNSKTVLEINNQNLVPTDNNQGLILPNPSKPAVVGGDTLRPQLRIPLDTVFARGLLEYAEGATKDDDFLEDFKGLYFKVNGSMLMPNEGSILYLASSRPASKLTVYYTEHDTVPNKFDFIITGGAVDYNRFDLDYTGTNLDQVLTDSTLGQQEFYTQSFTSRAKIDMSSINDLPKDIIVHSATLELPVSYYIGSDLYPSDQVSVTAKLFKDDDRKYGITNTSFNSTRMSYVIDLRVYVQNILKGEIENNGVYIAPRRYNTTAERIVFNGANSTFKKQPKLKIVYTKL